MGWPVVVVAKGGIPVTEASAGLGTPLSVAANGYGTAVTVVGSGGLPVVGSGGAVEPPANRNPVAVADSGYTTPQNIALTIPAASLLANDTDPDGDPLTVTGVSAPVNGTVGFAANVVTFTPTTNYTGPASFSYAISDGRGGTAAATVSLTVTTVSVGSPVTLFTATPALNADDANAGLCFRVVCPITSTLRDEARVTIQPGSVPALSIVHASIGKWNTVAGNSSTTAAPLELKFGGSSGFSAKTTAQTSDWTDVRSLTAASGDKLVAIYDVIAGGASTASQRYNGAAVGTNTYFLNDYHWSDIDTVGDGYTELVGKNYCIASIETRTNSGLPVEVVAPIPMTFNDPIFTGMTELTSPITLALGQNITRQSIVETTGNPSITCDGGNAVNTCRVNSRECIRLQSGITSFNNCYFESLGVGIDHADTIQAYAPGTRGASVTITNTHVVAHTTAATANVFVSDDWDGTLTFQDVIFNGGPYGLEVHAATGCNINISLKNCYFIAPFGNQPILIEKFGTGTYVITQWVNVRHAIISGGVVIPGAVIPQPA